MKYLTKQILVIAIMIFGTMGAWAQTVTKLTNGSWKFTMPNGDRTLNVVQIQECGLVWQIDGQPVPTEGVSGYVGYGSLVTFPTLKNENEVSVRYGSTNTAVATINNANGNEITLVGAGTTTIYAVHDADENYLYDSAYYTLTVKASYTLTLTSNPPSGNAGHLELDSVNHALPAGVVAGDAPYKYIVDPGTTVKVNAVPAPHYHLAAWNNTGGNALQQEVTITQNTVITGVFAIDTFTLTLQTNDINKGTVEVTNHNEAIVSHAPDANGTSTHKVNHGAEVIIQATPVTHYHLESWSNGATVNTDDTIHVNVTTDSTITANFAIDSFAITAVSDPEHGGYVSGTAGNQSFENGIFYGYGTEITLTATPNLGYHFVNWTNNEEEVVSTVPSFNFMVTDESEYMAHFAINTYTVAALVNPESSGSVDGTGTYNQGATVTLTATPATGYHFVNWTKGDEVVSADATYSFTVTHDSSFVANFAINTYTIAATFNPANSGTVTGAGSYNYGATCTLTATPAEGYHFVNWTKGGTEVSTEDSYTFTVTKDSSFVANFAINTYNLTLNDNGNGSAAVKSPLPAGVTDNQDGTYTVNHGTTVTVEATPNEHYHLTGWSNITGTALQQTFAVTKDSTITASFAINIYTLTLTADGNGTVALDGLNIETFNNFHSGQSDYTGENIKLHEDNPLDGGFQIWHNNFMIYYYYTATITSMNGENITKVELTRGSTSCYQGFYNDLDRLTVNHGTLSVNGDMATITGINASSLTIGAQLQTDIRIGKVKVYYGTPPEGITEYTENNAIVANKYNVAHGTELTVKATAAQLHHVAGWSDEEQNNLSAVATYSDYAVTNPDRFPAKSSIHVTVTGDTTMMATFYLNSYEVNASVANGQSELGTVQIAYTDANNQAQTIATTATVTSVQATALGGSTSTVTAMPNYGYVFSNWSDNVTDNPRTTSEAANYTANFDFDQFTVTAVVANGQNAMGTASGTATVNYLSNVTLTAQPADGHRFVNWIEADTIYSTDATIEVLALSNRTLTANFAITPAELSWNPDAFTGYTYIDFNNDKPTLDNPHNVNVRYGLVENVPSVKVNPETGYISNSFNAPILYTPGTYHVYAVHETDQTYYYDSVVYTLNVNRSALVSVSQNIEEGGSIAFVGAENDLTHSYSIGNAMIAYLAPGANFKATADANDGYHFSKWQTGNNVTGYTDFASTNTTTYTAPAEITGIFTDGLKAVFDTNTYALNVESANLEMGSGNGSTTAKHFLNYEISATPNTGYHFVQWNDGNTANPRTVTLTSDSTFTASFAPNSYTITYMDGETELNVDTFDYKQPITEYTSSKTGWDFIGWSPTVPDLMPAENLTVYAQWFYICHPVTDIDNNTYSSVNIGNICWMTSNMRATHYADGQREIANIYVYATPLHPNADENLLLFGRLYDWYDALDASRPTKSAQVQGICPDGWVIPNEEDFETLNHVNLHTLLSSNYWVYNNGDNSTDFDLRPSGTYNITLSRYEELLSSAYLWSATATSATEAHCHEANCHCNDTLLNLIRNKENAFSVRCVKKP